MPGQSDLYLKPTGLLHGVEAQSAVKAGLAGWLAGGPAAFSLVEVIERRRAEPTRRHVRLLSYADARASSDVAIITRLERICAAPSPMAGLDLHRPLVMGIVNVTPDSFSDGSLFAERDVAIAHGRSLIVKGADILDIGGESTRPGARDVPPEEEAERVAPVIAAWRDEGVPISIDTRKSLVMHSALAAGAAIVNDVSALGYDPKSLEVVRDAEAPVVLMHAQGTPQVMQKDPRYDDVSLDIFDYLAQRIDDVVRAGIARSRIIADPGIGFGKTVEHNLTLLRELSLFHGLGVPILLGASRKAFVGSVTGEPEARMRVAGSVQAAMIGVAQGVQILRVHDVRETVQAIAIWRRVNAVDGSADLKGTH